MATLCHRLWGICMPFTKHKQKRKRQKRISSDLCSFYCGKQHEDIQRLKLHYNLHFTTLSVWHLVEHIFRRSFSNKLNSFFSTYFHFWTLDVNEEFKIFLNFSFLLFLYNFFAKKISFSRKLEIYNKFLPEICLVYVGMERRLPDTHRQRFRKLTAYLGKK